MKTHKNRLLFSMKFVNSKEMARHSDLAVIPDPDPRLNDAKMCLVTALSG